MILTCRPGARASRRSPVTRGASSRRARTTYTASAMVTLRRSSHASAIYGLTDALLVCSTSSRSRASVARSSVISLWRLEGEELPLLHCITCPEHRQFGRLTSWRVVDLATCEEHLDTAGGVENDAIHALSS